jgi:RNA polymerase sigma factor (sigma-70 family)
MASTTSTFCEPSSAPDTIEALLHRHRSLIYLAVNRYLRWRPDLANDILQEARIALAEALKTYRVEMGFTFSTYAVRQMRWRAWKFLDRFTRKDRVTGSLDEPCGEYDGEEFTLADIVAAQAAARDLNAGIAHDQFCSRLHDLREAIKTCKLAPGERAILDEFLKDGNGAAVASRLGLTPARVSQVLTRVAVKLRKVMARRATLGKAIQMAKEA